MDNHPDQPDNLFNSSDISKLCKSINHKNVSTILNSKMTTLLPPLQGVMDAWIEWFFINDYFTNKHDIFPTNWQLERLP